jgi:hypothetical protein
MHNQKQQQHLKTNNIIMSKLAVIVLSIVLLTGLALVPALQSEVYSQVQQQQDNQGRGQEEQDNQGQEDNQGRGQEED